jgi:hypothetical protein
MNLRCLRVRLELTVGADLSLPPFAVSTLRGGFGHAFRKVACALRRPDCDGCPLIHECVYSYVFETPRPPDVALMRLYPTIPHPFVLAMQPVPRTVPGGHTILVDLTLIGKAIRHLNFFVYAFEELGRLGLGRMRIPFRLTDVAVADPGGAYRSAFAADTGDLAPPEPDLRLDISADPAAQRPGRAIIEFVTPTRMKADGRTDGDIPFPVLIKTLMRRLRALAAFHEDGTVHEYPARDLIPIAEAVSSAGKLRFVPLERFSYRQKQRFNMDGFVGVKTYEGNLGPFLNLLHAGEVVHVGKGTAFGQGQYRIKELTL